MITFIEYSLTPDSDEFLRTYLALEAYLLDGRPSALLDDRSKLPIVIQSYVERIAGASLEASLVVKLFRVAAAEPLSRFAVENFNSGKKHYAIEILALVLITVENMQLCIDSFEMNSLYSSQLSELLALRLIRAGAIGQTKVEKIIRSMNRLFQKRGIANSLFNAMRAYCTCYGLPKGAQIYMNCATAFASNEASYVLGEAHILLAKSLYREARRISPVNVPLPNLTCCIRNIDLVLIARRQILGIELSSLDKRLLETVSEEEFTYIKSCVRTSLGLSRM